MSKLTGKVAVVTGASKGIGAAIAKSLGAAGASVVVNYASDKTGAEAVVKAITNFGKLDVVINNSGIYAFAPLEAVTEESFTKQFGTNVLGTLLVTQAALPHLGQGASVINIGSLVSRITPPNSAVYTGTKGAVDAITGVLSVELGPKGIRVNALNPGLVETEGTHTAGFIGSDFHKEAVSKTPLGRTGQPQDIADVAVFLASDEAGWLTGQLINAAGGVR